MAENEAREALDITVKGVVQGVGFRPFVFRCAQKFHLTGWVLNALDGVTIHVEGTQNDLDCFAIALVQEAPEAANVKELELNEAPKVSTNSRSAFRMMPKRMRPHSFRPILPPAMLAWPNSLTLRIAVITIPSSTARIVVHVSPSSMSCPTTANILL